MRVIVNDIIFHAEGPYNWLRENFAGMEKLLMREKRKDIITVKCS
jgi:hypothetical protein